MTCNVGTLDRTLRILAGIAILGTGWYFGSYWGLIGLIPVATGTVRWCPLYATFGISTVGRKGR